MRNRLLSYFSVVLIMLCASTTVAAGQAIAFYVTNHYHPANGKGWLNIFCTGPFFRNSGSVHIEPNVENQLFYTAKDNILSAFGSWGCKLSPTTQAIWGTCFELTSEQHAVHITIEANRIIVDAPPSNQCLFKQVKT